MNWSIVNKNLKLIACLLLAGVLMLLAGNSVSAQSSSGQARVRWKKLVYEDAKALIQETKEKEKNDG